MNPAKTRVLLAFFMGITALTTGAAVLKTIGVSNAVGAPVAQSSVSADLSGNITVVPDASSNNVVPTQDSGNTPIAAPTPQASVAQPVAAPAAVSSPIVSSPVVSTPASTPTPASPIKHRTRAERDDDYGSSEIDD